MSLSLTAAGAGRDGVLQMFRSGQQPGQGGEGGGGWLVGLSSGLPGETLLSAHVLSPWPGI